MNIRWERLARIVPASWQTRVEERVRQAGLRESPAEWSSVTILLMLLGAGLGGAALWFAYPWLNGWIGNLIQGVSFPEEASIAFGVLLGGGLVLMLRMLHVYYSIESRRNHVEEILPDFLLLVAGNIRAGMTSFSAFKNSSRPEFGPLSEEVRSATTRSLGTDSFGSALSSVSARIQSKSLNESVQFFLQAIRSGGKVAQLLENTATDLRRTQDLKKELETSTRTYVIFVAFVMMIATPLLMAVSVEFVGLITRIQSQNNFLSGSGDSAAGLGFLGTGLSITPAFLESVAYVLLLGNAILAGIFMGTIGQGKPLLGLRYTPLLFIISIAGFFLAKGILAGILGVS